MGFEHKDLTMVNKHSDQYTTIHIVIKNLSNRCSTPNFKKLSFDSYTNGHERKHNGPKSYVVRAIIIPID